MRAFTVGEASRITGASVRIVQADLDRGWLRATIQTACGKGYHRLLDQSDIVAVALFDRLRRHGIKGEPLRRLAVVLKRAEQKFGPLHTWGERMVVAYSAKSGWCAFELKKTIADLQELLLAVDAIVLAVPVGATAAKLREAVADLESREQAVLAN